MQVIHQRHFLMNRASQFSGILVWKCNKSALESINAIHQSWPDERKQILIKWQKKKKSLLFARNANNIFHHQRRWCLASNSWNCETVQCRYIVCMRSQDETGQYIKLSVIANTAQLLQISLQFADLLTYTNTNINTNTNTNSLNQNSQIQRCSSAGKLFSMARCSGSSCFTIG